MKHIKNTAILIAALFAAATFCRASVSRDSVIVKPDIIYSMQQNNYILGGFIVDGVANYDEELLRNISELREGQTLTIPGRRHYKRFATLLETKDIQRCFYLCRQYRGQ